MGVVYCVGIYLDCHTTFDETTFKYTNLFFDVVAIFFVIVLKRFPPIFLY